jgi:hypothetical protein
MRIMSAPAAMLLYHLAIGYACVGGVVALLFILFGVDRVDPASHGVLAFRPLLLPGAALLWPVVLGRWLVLERQRRRGR